MYEKEDSAAKQFEALDNKRQGILHRLEAYSSWTIPKLFPRRSREQDVEPLSHGYTALGAQAVNHLANQLMMTLFAPSRPFFRLDFSKKGKQKIQGQQLDMNQIQAQLAKAEQDASMELDKRSIRSRLYDLLKMLIVLGNALMILDKDNVRVLSMRNYVVKRDKTGKVSKLIIREKMHKSQIEPAAYALVHNNPEFKPDDDGCIHEYTVVCFDGKRYQEDTWLCDVKLPKQFSSSYTEMALPYRAVTWDLASGDNYGTGLVEDYEPDFQALTMLSEATLNAAILASEFRWIVNPAGMTSIEDFTATPNGGAMPGQKGDIELVASGVEGTLQTNLALAQQYIQRIGAGFLLQSAVTRNSERTTAEEIRSNAQELEGGLGGAYSRIAVDVQIPMANWTMKQIGGDLENKDIEPVIITGLAALSRTGDRDRLISFGQDLSSILQLPPQILDRLQLSAWIANLAAANGLDQNEYVVPEDQYQQMQKQRMQAQLAMQNASEQITNNNTPQETQ